jgi:hypothetical protein
MPNRELPAWLKEQILLGAAATAEAIVDEHRIMMGLEPLPSGDGATPDPESAVTALESDLAKTVDVGSSSDVL